MGVVGGEVVRVKDEAMGRTYIAYVAERFAQSVVWSPLRRFDYWHAWVTARNSRHSRSAVAVAFTNGLPKP